MRYYRSGPSLLIRGSFHAISTGVPGGCREVSCLSNHTVPLEFDHSDPGRESGLLLIREGITPGSALSLLTRVPMDHLCVFQHDSITCFITAGLSRAGSPGRTITIILTCTGGLFPGALAGAIITVTEAKTAALLQGGFGVPGTPTDAVIIASEGSPVHQYAGPASPLGMMITRAVMYGVPVALKKHEEGATGVRESFFVYSRIGGDHWTEWKPHACPYYPCHAKGQCCDFCYCPLYPCGDTSLGSLVKSASGGMVWNCSTCGLIHDPVVARYLKANPMAQLQELKTVFEKKSVPVTG